MKHLVLNVLALLPLAGCGGAQRPPTRSSTLSVRERANCTAAIVDGAVAVDCAGPPMLPCSVAGRGAILGPGTDAAVWTCTLQQDGEPIPVAFAVTDPSGVVFAAGATDYGAIANVSVVDAIVDDGGETDELIVEWVDETREWVLYRANAQAEIVGAADIVTLEPGSCGWTVEPAGGWPTAELIVRAMFEDEPTGAESRFTWSSTSGRFEGEPPRCETPVEDLAQPPE